MKKEERMEANIVKNESLLMRDLKGTAIWSGVVVVTLSILYLVVS